MFEFVKSVLPPKRLVKRSVLLKRRMPPERISERNTLRSTPPGCLSGQQTVVSRAASGAGIRSNSKPPTKESTGCMDSEKLTVTHFSTDISQV